MAIEITIPRLGWSMDAGIFGEWLVQDGEFVSSGDPIFTMESEKAIQEIESVDSGYLKLAADAPREGDEVLVGLFVGWLLQEGEAPPAPPTTKPAATNPATCSIDSTESSVDSSPASLVEMVTVDSTTTKQTVLLQLPTPGRAPQVLPAISPRAKRIANEINVDWTQLRGSGKTGRIREQDVRAASSLSSGPNTAPLTMTRKTIASRMKHSLEQTAPVTITTKAAATALVSLRSQLKSMASSSNDSPTPSFSDIVIKLVAKCLKRHPVVYAQWTGPELTQPSSINIGFAVDTEAGLLVPVIDDVPSLSLEQVASVSRGLIEKARSRSLSTTEMSGGVFSVSNLGAYGIDSFTPIINYPETAILGLGAIRREPVVDATNQIVARDQITLSLTFDHRVIDGAPAAAFLQTVCAAIEKASAWLID